MPSEDRGRTLVEELRAHVRVDCARAAQRYRRVHAIATETHARAAQWVGFRTRWSTTRGGVITEHDLDVLVGQEVSAATGLPQHLAEREVQVSRALLTVLAATLALLECGRIDPGRAQVLAESVAGLPAAQARKVEKVVLDGLPTAPLDGDGPVGPWDGCSPRAFAARVKRAVAKVRTDTEDQVRDEVRARTGTSLWVHEENPAMSTLQITGPTELIATVHTSVDTTVRP